MDLQPSASTRGLRALPFLASSFIPRLGPLHARPTRNTTPCSVQGDGDAPLSPPGPGQVNVKLRTAACGLSDIQPPNLPGDDSPSPPVGGVQGLFEVSAVGEGVKTLRPGDLAIPVIPVIPRASSDAGGGPCGTWRSRASLLEEFLVKVPREGMGDAAVAAHATASVATAIRVLADFSPERELGQGDRVVFTGASSAVAQVCSGSVPSWGVMQGKDIGFRARWRGCHSLCLGGSTPRERTALGRNPGMG